MFDIIFHSHAISQILFISVVVFAASTVIFLSFTSMGFFPALICGFIVGGCTFVYLSGFGGSGIGGGKGAGKGKGRGGTRQIESVYTKPVSKQKTPEQIRKTKVSKQKPEPDETKFKIVVKGNNFFINNQLKSFEEIDTLIKQQIKSGKIKEINFTLKTGYKAKAGEQVEYLAKEYNTHVLFTRKIEELERP